MKTKISVAFLGHPSVTKTRAKRIGIKYLDSLEKKHDIVAVVTIKNDPLGQSIRVLAKQRGLSSRTFDIEDDTSNSENFNYREELTVGAVMWASSRVILVSAPPEVKRAYSEMARPMCKGMHIKHLIITETV